MGEGGFRWHFGWGDYLAYLGYLCYAVCSLALPLVLPQVSDALGFSLARGGMLKLVQSLSMVGGMILSLFLVIWLRKATLLTGAVLLLGAGTIGVVLGLHYDILVPMMLVIGLGGGIFEAMTTGFVQDLHEGEQPARYINITHSCWSVGTMIAPLVVGGILARGGACWDVLKIVGLGTVGCGCLWLFFAVRAGFGSRGASNMPLPQSQQIQMADIWGNLGHIFCHKELYLFLMSIFLIGGMEHCLLFWLPTYFTQEFGQTNSLVCTSTIFFAFGMFCGRFFSGRLFSQEHLPWVLVGGSLLAACAGFWIPLLHSLVLLNGAVFLVGAGLGPLWPTAQSSCVEAIGKKFATALYVLMPCIGIPGTGIMVWLMGWAGDHLSLRGGFWLFSSASIILAILFGLFYRKIIFSHHRSIKDGEKL